MRTTIDLDESKVKSVMKLTGLNTRRAAVDYALTETERMVKLKKLLSNLVPDDCLQDVVDPEYDIMALREKEKPPYGSDH